MIKKINLYKLFSKYYTSNTNRRLVLSFKFNTSKIQKNNHQSTNNYNSIKDLILNYHSISLSQRIQLTLKEAFYSIVDKQNGTHYAAFTDLTSYHTLTHLHQKMLSNQVGKKILQNKPRITDQIIQKLQSYPQNTFGKAYYNFMSSHKFKPSQRPLANYIPDLQLAYVSQRYKEIHDFLHVLLFRQISVDEQLIVKWFEMIQLNLPSSAMAALTTPFLAQSVDIKGIADIINKAEKCPFILNIQFQKHFDKDLNKFRQELNL